MTRDFPRRIALPAALLILWLVQALLAPSASAVQRYTPEQIRALESQMAAWVKALRDKDTASFLTFFSETRPWRYLSTLPGETSADTVSFQRLKADLQKKQGWYEVLFDAGGDDVFRDHVLNDGGKPWRRRFLSFSPPDGDSPAEIYVRWRNEDGRWVIDTIAEPSS